MISSRSGERWRDLIALSIFSVFASLSWSRRARRSLETRAFLNSRKIRSLCSTSRASLAICLRKGFESTPPRPSSSSSSDFSTTSRSSSSPSSTARPKSTTRRKARGTEKSASKIALVAFSTSFASSTSRSRFNSGTEPMSCKYCCTELNPVSAVS